MQRKRPQRRSEGNRKVTKNKRVTKCEKENDKRMVRFILFCKLKKHKENLKSYPLNARHDVIKTT